MSPPPPEENKLLAALPAKERAALIQQCQWKTYERGETLLNAEETPEYLLFPVTLVAALMALGRGGDTTALALIGREGGIGFMDILAGEAPAHDVVALLPGGVWRLPARLAARHLSATSALLPAVLGHGHSLTAQIAQTAFCNLHHTLEQRLCRWLLSIAYRTREASLRLTEAQIAEVLGVRRETVSSATVRLQEEGLIRHQRGEVEILDRDSLEAKACECLPVFPWGDYPVRCVVTRANTG